MKTLLAIIMLSFFSVAAFSQQLSYSDIVREDNRNMNFEILGNFNGNTIIYKNNQRRHRLSIYDKNMAVVKEVKLDFISEKTFNVDFVTYPDYFFIIYQYQKGNYVYCDAARMNASGEIVGAELPLDTTKIGYWADNKIYYLTNSEDKKKILLYRMLSKNNTFTLSTFLYDNNLRKIDSTENEFDYNDRKENYGDLQVSNDGTFFYTKEISKNRADYTSKLEIYYHKQNAPLTAFKELPLDDKYVDDVKLKIDNLNNQIFINSFSYKRSGGSVDGLFTVLLGKDSLNEEKRAYNVFDDTVRSKLTNRSDYKSAFDNFYLRNIVLKKDSGILISMEEYYTQNRGYNRYNNRYNYYDPFGYSYGNSNYYRFQRSYYDPFYYRNDNYRNERDILYTYNDMLVFNFTKDLKIQWSNIINKKQSDVETDNFLSFATVNMGSEIHYLFVDKNRQVINDFALQQDGEMKRYATIKSGEKGYTFMPKLLKQVSARQIIIPCVFRNNVAFAKIDFSNIP